MRLTRWLHDAETAALTNQGNHLATDSVGFWYFWDECGCDAYGPYDTREQAEAGLLRYASSL